MIFKTHTLCDTERATSFKATQVLMYSRLDKIVGNIANINKLHLVVLGMQKVRFFLLLKMANTR